MPQPSRSTPQPVPSLVSAPPAYPQTSTPEVYGTPQPGISIDKLNDDIQQLIVTTKAQFAQAPLEASIQTRLRALLDLQSLLQRSNLNQDQLVLIKTQVSELAVNIRVPNTQAPALTPTSIAPVAVAPPPPVSAPPAPVSLDSLFGQGALATLLAGAKKPATPQQFSTPQPTQTPPPATLGAAIRSPAQQPAKPAAAVPADPMALMAMLRQSGLLPPPPPGTSANAPPPPPPGSFPQGLSGLLSSAKGAPVRQPGDEHSGDIQLTASSLKQ